MGSFYGDQVRHGPRGAYHADPMVFTWQEVGLGVQIQIWFSRRSRVPETANRAPKPLSQNNVGSTNTQSRKRLFLLPQLASDKIISGNSNRSKLIVGHANGRPKTCRGSPNLLICKVCRFPVVERHCGFVNAPLNLRFVDWLAAGSAFGLTHLLMRPVAVTRSIAKPVSLRFLRRAPSKCRASAETQTRSYPAS